MNIFKILASGDGNLKEPNISAFFAYLLNPKEDHRLDDLLLRKLWIIINENNAPFPEGEVDIKLEPPLHTDKRNNFCDIKITFSIKSPENALSYPKKVIYIENKIRESLNNDQLNNQIEGIFEFQNNYLKGSSQNYLVFITPDGNKYDQVLNNTIERNGTLVKHLYWNTIDKEKAKFALTGILGEIIGISEGIVKKTIESFIDFIAEEFKANNYKKDNLPNKKNIIKNSEYFKFQFLPSFCETRTLEIYSILSKNVEKILKESSNNKKHYISSNKKGIISYPISGKSNLFFVRFDISPYKIKVHLSNPSMEVIKNIKKEKKLYAKLEEGKKTKKNLEFFLHTLTITEEIFNMVIKQITNTLSSKILLKE